MKVEIEIESGGEMEDKVELSKLPPALRKKVEKYMSAKKPEKPMKSIKQMMQEAKLEEEDEE
jgi:hypothetical protein